MLLDNFIKKRKGVLAYNVELRNKLILLNSKYSQYKESLNPKIGEYYNIDQEYKKNKNREESLFEYTFNNKTTYSNFIVNQNAKNKKIQQYNINDINISSANWNNEYDNYLDYIDKIFNAYKDEYIFENGILSYSSIKYALQLNELKSGVISSVDAQKALNGFIITNPNTGNIINQIKNIAKGNLKDVSDTKIGINANNLLSHALYASATYNSTKNRQNKNSKFSYITPSLYNVYGNNLSTFTKLSDLLYIDSETGLLRDDLGADIKIIDDWDNGKKKDDYDYINKSSEELNDNSSIQFYNDQVKKYKKENYRTNTLYSPKVSERYKNTDTNIVNSRTGDFINARIGHMAYSEGDAKGGNAPIIDYYKEIDQFDSYNPSPILSGTNTLLEKTKKLFDNHTIKTMSARFHNGTEDSEIENNTIDTAWHSIFGNSHGRALLKLDAETKQNEYQTNGYSNPYCRTWTYHHQYSRLKDAIRPFKTLDDKGNTEFLSIEELQKQNFKYRNRIQLTTEEESLGGTELSKYSVLQNNGFVKIGPTVNDYNTTTKLGLIKSINSANDTAILRKSMFSIENLAWKDVSKDDLSLEQIGPNGGRIMWFPPYDLDFQESVNVEWGSNSFIGRGEKVYTYSNTDRTAQLNFTLLIDHPVVLNEIANKKIGQGSENDIDADILRFFAGCKPFELQKEVQEEEEKQEQPKEEEKASEGIKIAFAVFFPNNYSGNMADPELDINGNKSTLTTNYYLDSDWAEYLMCGQNISIPSSNLSPTLFNKDIKGYEIQKDDSIGISNDESGANTIVAKKYTNKHGGNYESGKSVKNAKKFYYRVDFDLRQNFLQNSNYKDKKSFGLNSKIDIAMGHFPSLKKNKYAYSFSEIYTALILSNDNLSLTEQLIKKYLLQNNTRENAVNELITILKDINGNSAKVKSIKCTGFATVQDKNNSNTLALRRAKTVGYWINTKLGTNITPICKAEKPSTPNPKLDINSELPKGQRSVLVEIELETKKIEEKNSIYTFDLFKAPLSYKDDFAPWINNGNIDNINGNTQQNTDGNVQQNSDEKVQQTFHESTVTIIGEVEQSNRRYDNEFRFFKDLQVTDPFIYKSIKEKYKYFDPAFHSMSPEGFNARLNFLHQCTRQGHTVSAADVSTSHNIASTAGNLSFGRMPVCVLRIGDFINTRMLIQSLSINYSNNGMQWDLNPEGAGVQPIYAQVSMGVILIGGSSMNAPVNRLQNAQTFNYYANTNVYDNRSDRVSIDSNGKLTYDNLYTPKLKKK